MDDLYMLEIIKTNPYRLLGIYSNSPTRERVANHNRLKAFLKVGKPVSFPLDLPQLLPAIIRTEESAIEADAKLALPNEQLRYAQFWFVKVTPIDDIAMNHLMTGNVDNAIAIWGRKDTASSLQNRIVCALLRNDYVTAINCASILYSSYSEELAKIVLGESYTINIEHLEYGFLDALCVEMGAQQLLPYISDNDWRQYIRNKVIDPLIETLQSAIDTAKASKGKGVTARLNAGTKLMNSAKTTLKELKDILSSTDLQYQRIADKLGLEILQCGIDYFNGSNAADAAHKAMTLQSYALSVVVGKMAKDRCRENVDILQKIIDELPPVEVFAESEAIKKELNTFNQLNQLFNNQMFEKECSNVVSLLKNTKPQLLSMKNQLGSQNPYYLKISTQIIGNALNYIIEVVNAKQGSSRNIQSRDKYNNYLSNLRVTLRAAWEAVNLMETFDMEGSFKESRFIPNRDTLQKLCDSVDIKTVHFSFLRKISSTEKLLWSIFIITIILLYLISQM